MAEHLQSQRAVPQYRGPERTVARRTLFVAVGAVVLGACSKDLQRDKLVAIAAAAREPGEPLWSGITNSFVVAVTPEGQAELKTMGPVFTELGSNRLIALANECTYSAAHIGRLAWCRPSGVFVCLDCSSRWTKYGTVVAGPATHNLTFLTLSLNSDDDIIIDKRARTPGAPSVPSQPNQPVESTCDQTFAAPT